MKKTIIFSSLLTLVFFTSSATANVCKNSSKDAGKGVIKWANAVAQTAKDVSDNLEEEPEDEVAKVGLLVVEATAELTEAIAKAFEGNAMGSPNPVVIPWNKLSETPRFWKGDDGDTIYMTKTKNASGSGNLIFQQKHTWWKGIVAFDKKDTNKWSEVACLSGKKHKSMTLPMNPKAGNTHYISLSKAKALGVHSNMYLITNWNDAPVGYDYTFNWVKD
jgi:hypothetical protein